MSRDDDKLIAEWLGYKTISHIDSTGIECAWDISMEGIIWQRMPWWSTSDSDAITLLPVLVERGISFVLQSSPRGFATELSPSVRFVGDMDSFWTEGTTISQAICSAVLELIRKEKL